MKRKSIIACLLLTALLGGCRKPETPLVTPPTSTAQTQAVIPEPEATQPPVPTDTAPTVPATQSTLPTDAPTTIPTTASRAPSAVTLPTIPPTDQGSTFCSHDYQRSLYQAPTCEQAGYQNYRCRKCGDVQQQLSLPLGHSYADASCTAPKCCIRCGITEGVALGHIYKGGFCSRCAAKDPSVRTITIQIKDSNNAPVNGVTVELHIADMPYATAVSAEGSVTFTLENHTGSYKLVLTGIPEGYKARKDSYIYRSDSGAIVLDVIPVVVPEDHSKAAYKVGAAMGDFTVTDIDGKTYQLRQLLQEKKLVILNFWYCTCVPCKAEFPYFNSIYQRYSDDIELLALNHFDTETQIRQLRSEMELCFPLATEHLGMQQGFGIQSYPMSVFIGSNGQILHIQKDIGFQSEAQLDTLIRPMIGK